MTRGRMAERRCQYPAVKASVGDMEVYTVASFHDTCAIMETRGCLML